VGQEAICTVRHEGKSISGKALLETSELILRGDVPLKIPFSAITSIKAVDGELQVRTKSGVTVFVLGAKAEKWRDRIANPKSLIEKLGPKAEETVSVVGNFSGTFLQELKQAGALVANDKVPPATKWIFVDVEAKSDLSRIKAAAKSMKDAMALWIVYPKGQKHLTESDVRGAGLKAGLTDVKVASFSSTHTALKFVIPKAKRK
jgi:hypothetical protein